MTNNSGEGSRPTTSGGVDNIGGGESFSPNKHGGEGEKTGPAPAEGMRAKRKDAVAAQNDDSAAFDLREDLSPEPNTDSSRVPRPKPAD